MVENLSSLTPTATVTGAASATVTLKGGLYLIIPHSNDAVSDPAVLPDKENYAKWDETDPTLLLGTQVRSTEYVYTFQPELISLQTTDQSGNIEAEA